MTGAGMMDYKKALTEANGDFEAAIDLLCVRARRSQPTARTVKRKKVMFSANSPLMAPTMVLWLFAAKPTSQQRRLHQVR